MKMNFAILFSLMITIFGLPRAFAAGGSSQEDSNEEPSAPVAFDLDAAKVLLNGMLDYFNGLGALKGDYQTLKNGITNAGNADSVIAAGKEILNAKGSQGNLVEKAEKDVNVARTMIEKIDTYKQAFWKLLDDAGLDGSRVPLATRLIAIRKKCTESLPEY
ncbi:uncharacterized protein LOC135840962 isoform X1 [Planococcus citri]|uniref:uncharacterized protein LOC135840962 isoform X1 n=1 Tax=Planococcus citri TaxID=170843 RepID=UPI0031F96D50